MKILLAIAPSRFSLNRSQVVFGKSRPKYHVFEEWLQSTHNNPYESRDLFVSEHVTLIEPAFPTCELQRLLDSM